MKIKVQYVFSFIFFFLLERLSTAGNVSCVTNTETHGNKTKAGYILGLGRNFSVSDAEM